jgi:hypothetical protein
MVGLFEPCRTILPEAEKGCSELIKGGYKLRQCAVE